MVFFSKVGIVALVVVGLLRADSLQAEIWQPHPEFGDKLEDRFSLWMLELYFKKESDSQWRRTLKTPTPKEFFETISIRVTETRRSLVDLPIDLKAWDIFEPLQTKIGSDKEFIDGFSLFPLQTLRREGNAFLKSLQSFSKNTDYPILYLIKERDLSYAQKLSLLMLITHNHLTEENLIKAVALAFGVKEAWESARAINEAYRKERVFWDDKVRDKKINVQLERRVFSPLFGVSPTKSDKELITFSQRYHYYGALIMGIRGLRNWPLQPEVSQAIVRLGGFVYKIKTGGVSSDQLERISNYYRIGARHALKLLPWFNPQAEKR